MSFHWPSSRGVQIDHCLCEMASRHADIRRTADKTDVAIESQEAGQLNSANLLRTRQLWFDGQPTRQQDPGVHRMSPGESQGGREHRFGVSVAAEGGRHLVRHDAGNTEVGGKPSVSQGNELRKTT